MRRSLERGGNIKFCRVQSATWLLSLLLARRAKVGLPERNQGGLPGDKKTLNHLRQLRLLPSRRLVELHRKGGEEGGKLREQKRVHCFPLGAQINGVYRVGLNSLTQHTILC